jgi:hypothetical protein
MLCGTQIYTRTPTSRLHHAHSGSMYRYRKFFCSMPPTSVYCVYIHIHIHLHTHTHIGLHINTRVPHMHLHQPDAGNMSLGALVFFCWKIAVVIRKYIWVSQIGEWLGHSKLFTNHYRYFSTKKNECPKGYAVWYTNAINIHTYTQNMHLHHAYITRTLVACTGTEKKICSMPPTSVYCVYIHIHIHLHTHINTHTGLHRNTRVPHNHLRKHDASNMSLGALVFFCWKIAVVICK